MSSKLTFSYLFRAQRRKTDRSASALILFLPLSFFSDKVYVPFCTLLRDMLVSTLSSFRKDPNLLVKIKSKTKSKLKLAKRKLKIKIKPNENDERNHTTKLLPKITNSYSDLDFNPKLDLSDIKRLVSGGYTRVLLRYCVLLWQRVNLDTKISSVTVTSLTTLTFFPQSLAPGDPGEPGEAGPGPSHRVPEEAGPPPHDQGKAALGPSCSKPGPRPHGHPDQDPRPGPDELPEQPRHDPAEPDPGHPEQLQDLSLLWSQWAGHPLYRYVLVLFPKIQQDSPRSRMPTGPRIGYGYGSKFNVCNFKQLMDARLYHCDYIVA